MDDNKCPCGAPARVSHATRSDPTWSHRCSAHAGMALEDVQAHMERVQKLRERFRARAAKSTLGPQIAATLTGMHTEARERERIEKGELLDEDDAALHEQGASPRLRMGFRMVRSFFEQLFNADPLQREFHRGRLNAHVARIAFEQLEHGDKKGDDPSDGTAN